MNGLHAQQNTDKSLRDIVFSQEGTMGGGRARRVLLRSLIDYISLPSSQVEPQDRFMAGDILLDMLFEASNEQRMLCAARLAESTEAPRRLLRYLAQCDIEIARPVLENNEALDSSDINQIFQTLSSEHYAIIAGRKVVAPIICDLIAAACETGTICTMLKNKGATLSEHAVDLLVARSRRETIFCDLLIKRPELRPSHALTIFWWSSSPTRRSILRRFAADRTEMIEMCKDVFAIVAQENWQDPVARKAVQLIERRQRNRAAIEKSPYESLEQAVKVAATLNMNLELAQEIGYLAGVKPVTIAKILSDQGGDGLAVLCKATGLKRAALGELWQSLKRPMQTEDGQVHPQFAYVEETFDLLTTAKAQTTLRYWNWSLSSTFSMQQVRELERDDDPKSDTSFLTARRIAKLVFSQ